MIRIYYHIYVIDGVETIINEQLSLLKKCINKPYSYFIRDTNNTNNRRKKRNINTQFSFNKLI